MNNQHTRTKIVSLLATVCFALSPQARAVCQEGCLTLDNTVLSDPGSVLSKQSFCIMQ
jgi:hypothetical protein